MSDTAYVSTIPDCDLCARNGVTTPATFDGKTRMGPWANMCGVHHDSFGVGVGTGRGQRLVLGEKPTPVRPSPQAISQMSFDELDDLVGDGDIDDFL